MNKTETDRWRTERDRLLEVYAELQKRFEADLGRYLDLSYDEEDQVYNSPITDAVWVFALNVADKGTR